MRSPKRRIHATPTQKDIAEALGLAQSTVATALNPKTEHRLHTDTAEQIKAYAREIGYRHQRFAQILRGSSTQTVGVVVKLGNYSNHHDLIALLINELNRRGCPHILVDPAWFDGSAEGIRDSLLNQAVEGIIFNNIPFPEAEALKAQLPDHLPVISLASGTLSDVPEIRVDTDAIYHRLTRYFIETGSSRLVCLASYRDPGALWKPDWSKRERMTGFAAAIREAGGKLVADAAVQELLEVRAETSLSETDTGLVGEIVFPVRPVEVTNAYEHGYYQALRLLQSEKQYDAFICMNDNTALGTMAACADLGINVPGEIRISGYDDTTAARFASIPLTSVRKPLKELAERAIEMILARMRDSSAPIESHLLPAEIVLRRSTGVEETSDSAIVEPDRFTRFSSIPHPAIGCH